MTKKDAKKALPQHLEQWLLTNERTHEDERGGFYYFAPEDVRKLLASLSINKEARESSSAMRRAYDEGWCECAVWAKRLDLITECDSAAYERDWQAALTRLAGE